MYLSSYDFLVFTSTSSHTHTRTHTHMHTHNMSSFPYVHTHPPVHTPTHHSAKQRGGAEWLLLFPVPVQLLCVDSVKSNVDVRQPHGQTLLHCLHELVIRWDCVCKR